MKGLATYKITPVRREALEAARDKGNAYECIAGHYGQSARRRSEAIGYLMVWNLLWGVPGPRWATLTDEGRAVLGGRDEP